MEYLLLLVVLGLLYMFFRQKKGIPKTKEQKQSEILYTYQEQMKHELMGLDGDDLKKRKMTLLKKIADELNRNLFFDENETKNFIQKLIDGK